MVSVMIPAGNPWIRLKMGAAENVTAPLKLGVPENEPLSEPPSFITVGPLNVVVPENVLFPVHALLPERNGGGVTKSRTHCCAPVEQVLSVPGASRMKR